MQEQKVQFDVYGEEYVVDQDGNKVPPMQTTKHATGNFGGYDSPNHCSFCGKLTCRGGCFK